MCYPCTKCNKCGAFGSGGMRCPDCGHENETGSERCSECGAYFPLPPGVKRKSAQGQGT